MYIEMMMMKYTQQTYTQDKSIKVECQMLQHYSSSSATPIASKKKTELTEDVCS